MADKVAPWSAEHPALGGGRDNSNLSGMLRSIRDAKLTEQNRKDLVEFLKALSGESPIINPPNLP